jgi:IclR family transcriptional regulator, acetate operon repressor
VKSENSGADIPRHQTVRSVVKATQLLLLIADSDGMQVADAARKLGMPLTTAYHLVNTLLAEGMLSRDSGRRYRLGPKIATLTVAYARGGPSEQLLSAVRRLSEVTRETAYLSEWRDGEVVARATIEGSSTVRVGQIHTELRGHEHARAAGQLMLAHLAPNALDAYLDTHSLERVTPSTIVDEKELRERLADVRRLGYAAEEAEFTEGVGCVSAPVLDGGTCYACLTISAPLERFRSHRERLIAAVVDAGRAASNS